MSSNWSKRRVGDFATRKKIINYVGEDLPPLSVTKDRGVLLQSEKYKKRVATDPRKYVVVEDGDFAFDPMSLYYGALGRVGGVGRGLISPDYAAFTVDATVDPTFLEYKLRSAEMIRVYESVAQAGNQFGKRRRVYWSVLAELPVLLPPLPEQRDIAATLRAVDEAIAAGAKVVGQVERVRGALVEQLLDKAPNREEGAPTWKAGMLAEYLREPIRNGYSPVCPAEPTGRWTLSLSAVTPEGFSPAGKKPAPLDDPQVDAARLLEGDVLVSRSNTRDRVGLAGVYRGEPQGCSYPDLLMRVRTADGLLPEFLELQLLSAGGRRYFQERARGTSGSMVKVNRAIVEAFPVVLPPVREQQGIVDLVRTVTQRLYSERAVVAERRRVRAALADALLSGHLRLRDAA